MTFLADKKILLGVTGGIAAYKAAELTRLLRGAGAEVQVVMTEAAEHFVGALTFQALSGNPVQSQLLDAQTEAGMGHISLARWADLILVAPAGADFIARLRAGSASDLLSAICLATDSPLALAPAMNQAMWRHPATQENIARLAQWGTHILGPASGSQACGEDGPGRMLEPAELLQHIALLLSGSGALSGLSVLISAGPTREPLDPIRYISNRSSGKMGLAVAQAALRAGAKVGLVYGPIALTPPVCHENIRVETAQDMYQAVLERASDYDIYIGTAAVADYSPAAVSNRKIKKNDDELNVSLTRTADILAAVAKLECAPFTVGFAAETDNLEVYALGKLENKSIDMIAANAIGGGTGFDSDTNALSVFWRKGSAVLALASKTQIAEQLIDLIAQHYHAKNPTKAV